MFRAVPLASAALLGARFGRKKLWIGVALVVEAVVFGSGHASYASEPAYSRPVELILPSLLWGFVYLRYGLLPAIIAHYLFDLSLFAIPLFATTAAGSPIDRIAVIACGTVPVLVVAVAVLRRRGLGELPDTLRNGAWSAPDEEPEEFLPQAPRPVADAWPRTRTRAAIALGALGLIAFVLAAPWRGDAPPLQIRRGEAIARRATLPARAANGSAAKRLAAGQPTTSRPARVARARRRTSPAAGNDLDRRAVARIATSWRRRRARRGGGRGSRATGVRGGCSVLPEAGRAPCSTAAAASRTPSCGTFGLDPARLREVSRCRAGIPSAWTGRSRSRTSRRPALPRRAPCRGRGVGRPRDRRPPARVRARSGAPGTIARSSACFHRARAGDRARAHRGGGPRRARVEPRPVPVGFALRIGPWRPRRARIDAALARPRGAVLDGAAVRLQSRSPSRRWA